jgi:hypothetical protein
MSPSPTVKIEIMLFRNVIYLQVYAALKSTRLPPTFATAMTKPHKPSFNFQPDVHTSVSFDN